MHVQNKLITKTLEIIINSVNNSQTVLHTNIKIIDTKIIIDSRKIMIVTVEIIIVEVDRDMNVSSMTLDHLLIIKIVIIKK